jgi:hypothetical protein
MGTNIKIVPSSPTDWQPPHLPLLAPANRLLKSRKTGVGQKVFAFIAERMGTNTKIVPSSPTDRRPAHLLLLAPATLAEPTAITGRTVSFFDSFVSFPHPSNYVHHSLFDLRTYPWTF